MRLLSLLFLLFALSSCRLVEHEVDYYEQPVAYCYHVHHHSYHVEQRDRRSRTRGVMRISGISVISRSSPSFATTTKRKRY